MRPLSVKQVMSQDQDNISRNKENIRPVSDNSERYLVSHAGKFGKENITQPEPQVNQLFSEKAKLKSNKESHIQKVIWEWKSYANPLSSGSAQWTPYSKAENDVLEKAYQNKERQVILDEWIVHISDKDMFQQRIDDASQNKPVRRILKAVQEVVKLEKEPPIRKQRFIGGERPKTYTNAFGSLDDYLSFFENRAPEMAKFAAVFRKAETNQDLDNLNQEIVSEVIDCIQEKATKLRKKEQEKNLIKLFAQQFLSFEHFYGTILRAYTLETFLYSQMNEYLRNEDWTQLDGLLPYAFCLCKAFQCSELTSKCNKFLKEPQDHKASKMILYRGARFDEASLSCYDLKSSSPFYFSWHAITSTSTNRNVAEFFSETCHGKNKIPILFIIEMGIEIRDNQDNLNVLDIETLSEVPGESEIVLAPGSIFELLNFTRDSKGAQIKLRLISDVSVLPLQGKIMAGAMHAQVSKGKAAKIMCHEGTELMEAISHLKGNRMIEELEFRLCKYDDNTLNLLTEVLPTLANLTKLSLFSNSSKNNNHLEILFVSIKELKIVNIVIEDGLLHMQNYFDFFLKEMRKQRSLLNLEVNFGDAKHMQQENCFLEFENGEIEPITSLKTLSLNFRRHSEMTDERVKSLWSEGRRYLASVTTLTVNFSGYSGITDEGVKNLCFEGLRYLTSLTTLTLGFNGCSQITDEGMKSMCSEGLRYLTSLRTLALDFSSCSEITDEGVKSLCLEGFAYLTSLTSLTLGFSDCSLITDEGMESLGTEGLSKMIALTTLNLYLNSEDDLADEGLKSLCLRGLKYLTALTTLALHFSWCREVTDEGIKSLGSEGLRYLCSLTVLTLNFCHCEGITDEGVNIMCSEGFRHLTSLRILTLDFTDCFEITDEGVKSLCSEGIRYLTSLTTLTLDFTGCSEITDEGLKSLCSEGIRYLTSLTILNLDFTECNNITDEGVDYVKAQTRMLQASLNYSDKTPNNTNKIYKLKRNFNSKNLKSIASTKHLSFSTKDTLYLNSPAKILDFYSNQFPKNNLNLLKALSIEIGPFFCDEKLDRLCSEGLRYLISLLTLTVVFKDCPDVTDEGVKNLCSKGLRYLTSLTTLTLNFTAYKEITDNTLKNLCSEGLRYFASLAILTLDFSFCPGITDEGVKRLGSEGLRHLTSLTTLTLDFRQCAQITDKGINSMCSEGLKNLTSFTTLTLNCSCWINITDSGLESMCLEGLRCLTSLITLTLNLATSLHSFKGIANKRLKKLCFKGLQDLTSLTTLNLNFSCCKGITDEGVTNLCSEGLRYLTSLTALTINLNCCLDITNEGVKSLCLEGLRHLTSLTTLALYFNKCSEITNEGVKSLCVEGLRYLVSLTTLVLDFDFCSGITDEGVERLGSEGLRYLPSLATLTLNFHHCDKITDQGVNCLCSKGFRYLGSLANLTLNFSESSQITDKGVKSLCSEGLIYLASLTSLTLNFNRCSKLTNEGLKNLCSLKDLASLTTLALEFKRCSAITDEGMKIVSEGLRYLTPLTNLALNFQDSRQLTDVGLNSLCSEGLRYLTSLTNLTLDFGGSPQITPEGLKDLLVLLRYFRFK